MTPEFSRPERLDAIGEVPRDVAIEADEGERAALARRFGLPAVDRLVARFAVRRTDAGIVAEGRVEADVVQACSVTDDPIPARVDEPVCLLFADDAAGEEELELAEDALDVLPIGGGAVDLGEAAAETMALALDPFPRSAAAEATLRAAGVIDESEARAQASPMRGLAALKAALDGNGDGNG